jgi:hypothetical protein
MSPQEEGVHAMPKIFIVIIITLFRFMSHKLEPVKGLTEGEV